MKPKQQPSDRPTVSVLVTVYNREQYLAQTLRSILNSTYQNFEVVVVDDCSKDDSLRIAREVATTDGRIRVTANPTNLGDYGNRRKAASLARGTFIKYVDSDDLIYPHTLGVMVDAITKADDIALALSHSLPEDEQPYPWVLPPKQAYVKHFLGRGCFACGPTGAIIRKSAFEEVCGFRPEWKVLSDIDLWLRLAAKWPVALMPPGLVWWRRHPDQEFTKDDAATVYLELGHQLDCQALQAHDCPMSDEDRQKAISGRRRQHGRRLLSLGLRGRKPLMAFRQFRSSDLSFSDLAKSLVGYQ